LRRRQLAVAVALGLLGLACFGRGVWIRVEAHAAQWLLERAWRASLDAREPVRPWPGARAVPIARLEAPGHGISWIVLSDVTRSSLARAPGHVESTASPGSSGNSVLAGHRDTHFRFLQHLQLGDLLVLVRPDGVRLDYRVEAREIFDIRTPLLEPTDAPALTLVTCYPFGFVGPAPQRFAVRAAYSQASPTPLPFPSAWPGLKTSGQLSHGSPTKSPSRSDWLASANSGQ